MLSNQAKSLLSGLTAVLCWSTVATAFKLALDELDTIQLVFYANITASIALVVIVFVRGTGGDLLPTLKTHWRLTLIAGLMNPIIYYLILFQAYELLPAQVAMSINYTWAIVLALMAIIFLKQKMLPADAVAAIVCYGGVFVIATQGDFSAFGRANLTGVGLALLSTIIWAAYWTINIADKREPVVGLCLNFLVALPVSFLLCLTLSDLQVSPAGFTAAIYVGLIEMAIAFVLWSVALNLTTNASRIGNLIFLSPFLSLIIINQILGEALLTSTFIGLFLIIGGLLYQQFEHHAADRLESSTNDHK